MNRESGPRGRKKNVTSGGGEVHKRGDGLNLGGPVGDAGGYSDRNEPGGEPLSGAPENGSPQRGLGGSSGGNLLGMIGIGLLTSWLSNRKNGNNSGNGNSGGGRRRGGGCGCLIVLIVVLVIGAFFLLPMLMQEGGMLSDMDGGSGGGLTDFGGLVGEDYQQPSTPAQSQFGGNYGSNSGGSNVGVLDTSVAAGARPKRTVIRGGGADTVTVMVYMCGTDLESKYGMATSDLQEMLGAKLSGNVNLIVETGGASKWQNSVVSNRTNQIYQVTSKGLKLLEEDIGRKAMTDPNTLSEYIRYCKQEFPADRYELILWDHGGGSVGGYGYDELYPNGTMTLDKLYTALGDGGCYFDFVGFDACLMATLETAIMFEPFADYLIASEETEPGTGWYYTDWLTELSNNTSMPTIEIGKNIADDFRAANEQKAPSDSITLSLIDLAELKATVPQAFSAFSQSTTELINTDQYKLVSDARGSSREFAQSAQINQVDLIDLAENMGTPEGLALSKALRGCVKYNTTSRSMTNAYGVSIYFPYGTLGKLDTMLSTYQKIGIDSEYSRCIQSFANMEAGGHIAAGGSGGSSGLGSLLGSLLGGGAGAPSAPSVDAGSGGSDALMQLLTSALQGGDYSSMSGISSQNSGFLDQSQILENSGYYNDNRFHAGGLVLSEKDGERVLNLPDDQWELIQQVELNVFLDDGEGFIDLGLDNTYEFDDDGDLVVDYDGTWLAINGQVVSYYLLSETEGENGEYTITGRVPAMLNRQLVDLILVFNDQNPNGVVAGARINYDGKTDVQARGLIEIKPGDTLDFVCDYYGYDEKFRNNYYIGEQLVVSGPLTISDVSIGNEPYKAAFKLTDLYHNVYWTPAITGQD